jgi:cytochrome c biogenesis protein CcmG/thiol:disulfide interchange protein DsbE
LPLLSGGALSSEELDGSPVVLNFFASWCAPCREEAPLLQAAWREHRDDGVQIVGVDVNDTEDGARRFVREFGITYPVVRDVDDKLIGELGVRGLPQTFFINRDWELSNVASGEQVGDETRQVVPLGAISRSELEANIERLLEKG